MNSQGTLTIRVTDNAGNSLPCRLHIKQVDDTCWVPPDVRNPEYSETHAPDLVLSAHYDRYLHVCHGANLQAIHLSRGSATFPVPTGEVQVFLARGHEYIPVIDRLEIKPDTTLTREYVLTRQIDLPSQNWYGGDMHTHISQMSREWLTTFA